MSNKRRANDRWVVTSNTPSPMGEPRFCFTDSGSSSQIRSDWAQFYSWQDAKEWATRNVIEVDDITHCIIQVKLSDFDISVHNARP